MSDTYRAAGALFLSRATGRVLLNLRSKFTSNSGTWSFCGGMVHQDETVISGLIRELNEEIGQVPDILKSYPLDIFQSLDGKFYYYTMLIIVEDEFIPNLNKESDGYCWCRIGSWPKPLHAGAKKLLLNKQIKKNLFWAWEEIKD